MALAQLFEEYRPKLLAMVRRRLDPALAPRIDPEDILSETYLIAHRKWSGFQEAPTVSPYAWLYGIARECLIMAWRKHTRDGRDVHAAIPWPDASSVQMGFNLVGHEASPSENFAREELGDRMRQALAVLKDSDREILWMRHFDKLTFPEAGAILGIPENTATLRYVRALKRLETVWLRRNPADGPK